jgi:hypothetical protein
MGLIGLICTDFFLSSYKERKKISANQPNQPHQWSKSLKHLSPNSNK